MRDPVTDEQKPTQVLFDASHFEVLEANNVTSVTDTGSRQYIITFGKPINGPYHVSVDGADDYETEDGPKSTSIEFKSGEPQLLRITLQKDE